MCGLLALPKGEANMERMEEIQEEYEYHQYQHFISNSPWSYRAVLKILGADASEVMKKEQVKSGKRTGLIIDESCHTKKGNESVGVARQYNGQLGKVDNCQVGVYLSLVNGKRATLIEEMLYLPKSWTEDNDRCDLAGIPEEYRSYKTKPQLALDMIDKALENKVEFDWVGGDGLYGHNYELAKGLDNRALFFVLDVHKDQHVYLENPELFIPKSKSGRGRNPCKYKTLSESLRVDSYMSELKDVDWQRARVRKTTKGILYGLIHTKEVWVWNKKEAKVRKRTLVISKYVGKKGEIIRIKYSLSNGDIDDYSRREYAYFQAQRYWVERNFDDGKNHLGMSDYQVRKWKGWHHHHAIVFMAMLFMLKEQIDHEVEYPLMSLSDARKMVLVLICKTMLSHEGRIEKELTLMDKRHKKRQKSIDWHLNNDSS